MVGGRDTPKDVQDGPYGIQVGEVSNFEADDVGVRELSEDEAKKIGLEIYQASTDWLNSGRRARWNDSLRAFQSLHPSGSKYNSRDYAYRSSLFRPKTRSMVRKAEAQTATAFFANEDVVSIEPHDDSDPTQLAAADLMKELVQYHLTKKADGLHWFLTVIGARQDCEVMGICCASVEWMYDDGGQDRETQFDTFGDNHNAPADQVMRRKVDKPVIDLIAPENLRFDPGCDWRDPVNSSPYIVQLVPIYVHDAKERMRSGEWITISEGALLSSSQIDDDVTRRTREAGRVPGKDHDSWKPREFDIVWVRKNIIRMHGEDWHFLTIGSTGDLLTEPRPLKEVYLHGQRPYVVGYVTAETHKNYPSSKVELVSDLQRMANDDLNLRFDNIKLVLNPRQFVKQGSGIEATDIRTFMPGKVIMSKSPGEDVVWDRPPPPDQSAYLEQDRINLDFDELVGDFSNSSVQSTQITQQSATGMHLMSGQASGMNEYELRMFAETFAEPILALLIKTIAAYETDPVILAVAGNRAKMFQKYGISEITDFILNQEMNVKVNVGIGSTNPDKKLQHFSVGAELLVKAFGPVLGQGLNFDEVLKEVFGMLGYKDGERFFKPGFDPAQAMQQMGQQGKQAGHPPVDQGPAKIEAAHITAQSRLQEAQIDAQSRAADIQAEIQKMVMQQQFDMQKAKFQEDAETYRQLHNSFHDAAVQAAKPPPAPRGNGAAR